MANELQKQCECTTWCDDDLRVRLLTGHARGCQNAEQTPLNAALGLIAELAKGMEEWAADEDGVHDRAWPAYRRAKALQGVFLSESGE
jgi:hypothetical protein